MEISLTPSIQKVTVFLRNYKKHAFPMALNPLLTSKSLKQLITQRVSHIIKNLAIFLKGKQIDDSQNIINIQNNNIFHLVDLDRTQTSEINLMFRLHKQPQKLIKIKTTPQAIIREVIQNQLKSLIGKGQNQVFLVYVGKPLNIFKKFQEEYVEDQTQIIVVQYKLRLNIEPKSQHVEQINHTRVLRVASIASTKMNFAPAIGISTQNAISKFKTSISKKLQPKIIQACPKEESASPILKQKKEENKMKLEPIAPGDQLTKNYSGFDPHKQTAPGAEVQAMKMVIPHDPNFKQIKEQTVPANENLLFKEEDFIFAGDAELEQTQSILPESIQEAKQNLAKKKSSKEYS